MFISYKKIRLFLAIIIVLITVVFIINNSTTFLKLIYPVKYEEYVEEYAGKFNIDPYLVYAIIKAESGFDPKATSHKNAMGLMQITERTGEWGAESLKIDDFKPQDLYEPATNIYIGCWYLNNLMKEFNNNIDLVITAYNGGSGNVKQWLKDKDLSSSGEELEKIPFIETHRFLKRVKDNYYVYKRLYEKPLK